MDTKPDTTRDLKRDLARVSSRIDAVTVYREGALIRRAADLTRPDGGGFPDEVCLTGLPLALVDSSVRVRVEGVEGAGGDLPVAADVRVTLDVPERDDSLAPPADEELLEARAELRRLNGRASQLQRELARVERLVVGSRPSPKGDSLEPPPTSPTKARLALLEQRTRSERAVREEGAALARELVRAEHRLRELEARRERATSARQAHEHELRKALVVSLHADGEAPQAARLVVEYMVPGARWAPGYTIRMDGAKASLAMRAVVAQETGEDWRRVALTLSTADAQGFVELPELSSIRIGRRQARPPKAGWRPPPSGVAELFADYDLAYRSGKRPPSPSDAGYWEESTREIAPVAQPAVSRSGLMRPDTERAYLQEPEEPTMPNLRPPMPAKPSATPPPPRASMPPPAPMMASSNMAGMPARSRGAPAPDAKMQKKRGRRDARPMDEGGSMDQAPMVGGMAPGGGGGYYEEQAKAAHAAFPEEAASLTASADLLAYGDLRMAAPRAADRGSLRKADSREVYMALLVSQRVEVSFNVLAVIATAGARARAVAGLSLPGRYRPTGSDRYDYAYRAETGVDVPSDGAFHSIALVEKSASTSLHHVVVPRESTDVFRTAELKNPLGAPILAGPVDVYLGKDFLLTSDAPFTPPDGSMRLGLGVEQGVKVTRNTSYREETSGLLRGSLMLMHDIRIEVENNLDRPIECEVRERIPSTRKGEDDIEVAVEAVEPKWQPYKPELASSPESGLEGGHSWRVEVPAKGGRKALSARYSVKIAAKHELAGGNRREA